MVSLHNHLWRWPKIEGNQCLSVYDPTLRFMSVSFSLRSSSLCCLKVRGCSGGQAVEACAGEELQTEECNMSSCPGGGNHNP